MIKTIFRKEKQNSKKIVNDSEREGFEPSVAVKLRRFSKPKQSTALPPFHYYFIYYNKNIKVCKINKIYNSNKRVY